MKLKFVFVILILTQIFSQKLLAVSDTVWYFHDNRNVEFLELDLSPNGQFLALAYSSTIPNDTTIINPRIIRVADGQIVRELTGHSRRGIGTVSFLNDSILATDGLILNQDSTISDGIIIWNINTGDTIKTLVFTDSVFINSPWIEKIKFSNDGKYLFCRLPSSKSYWDEGCKCMVNHAERFVKYNVQNWEILKNDTTTLWVNISPASDYWISYKDTNHRGIHDINTDTLLYTTTFIPQAISMDGRYWAESFGYDSIFIWDYQQKTITRAFKTSNDSDQIYKIAFSSNGDYIIASGYRESNSIILFTYIIKLANDSLIYNYGNQFTASLYLNATSDSQKIITANSKNEIFCMKANWTTSTFVKEENKPEQMLYPNPASNFIEISIINPMLKHGVEYSDIKIYNVFGQIQTTPSLRDTPPWKGGEKVRIDVSGLAPGIYFVRIGDRVQKFVKM